MFWFVTQFCPSESEYISLPYIQLVEEEEARRQELEVEMLPPFRSTKIIIQNMPSLENLNVEAVKILSQR
jgi:hypothetical protein